MGRPSIVGMFDSTIRIWRPVTTEDSLAVESRDYVIVATVDAAANRSRSPVSPGDGGLAVTGGMRWYGAVNIDVQPRDVCEVMTGPDARRTWEVNEMPTHPRNHHTEVDCIEWNGVLPTEDVS